MTDEPAVVPVAAKPWWKSKTLWVNLLAILGGCLYELILWVDDSELGHAGLLVVIQGFVNVVLRVLTYGPVRLPGK